MDNIKNYEFVIQDGEYSGFKIKINGESVGQLPNLQMAIDRCKKINKNKENFKIGYFDKDKNFIKEIEN